MKTLALIPFEKYTALQASTSDSKDVRYYLRGVYFNDQTAYATNGHVMTVYENNQEAWSFEKPVILDLPKLAKCENVQICQADDLFVLIAHGAKSTKKLVIEPIEGTFPDCEAVIKSVRKDSVESELFFSFNTDVLSRLCNIFGKDSFLTFGAYDKHSAFVVRSTKMESVFSIAMPCKTDHIFGNHMYLGSQS